MDKIIKERILDNYQLPVTIQKTNKILEQLKKCVCKIITKNGNGTGFFCKIPYNGKELSVLMTNYHIIDNNFIKENKNLAVTLNDDIEYKNIEIDKKIIYTSKKYNTTIIEIKKEKENINDFLELDENIFNENPILYNESIYILQYPKYEEEQKAAISYGIIKQIDDFNIYHYCCTDKGSSGSPILRLSNNKIIGIHKEGLEKSKYNIATFLKEPIFEYLKNIKTKNNKEDDYNIIKNNNKISSINFQNNNNILKQNNNNYLKQNNNNILKQNNNNYLNKNFNIKNKNHKNNYIIPEIEIKEEDINKDIRIINSYEQYKRECRYNWLEFEEEYENEKEIEENCEIKIDGVKIVFSYFYRFNKKGKYLIQYSFKNILSKTNHLFFNCSSLININLSNFNSKCY